MAAAIAVVGALPSLAETPLARFEDYVLSLKGRWSGQGVVQLLDGRQMQAKCVATYFVAADGREIKQNLRCRNDDFQLSFSGHGFVDGNSITGTWKENKYEISGTFGGSYQPGVMVMQAESRNTGAIITVTSSGCEQVVEIAPMDAQKMGVTTISGTMRKC